MAALRLLLIAAILLPAGFAQTGRPDRAFRRYPFEKWRAEEAKSEIRWSIHPMPVRLSNHQRLAEQIQIRVDGNEMAKRRGRGALIFMIEFEDSARGKWQTHYSIDLALVPEGAKPKDFTYTQVT